MNLKELMKIAETARFVITAAVLAMPVGFSFAADGAVLKYRDLVEIMHRSKSLSKMQAAIAGRSVELTLSSAPGENYFYVEEADRTYFDCKNAMGAVKAGREITRVQVNAVVVKLAEVDDAAVFILNKCVAGQFAKPSSPTAITSVALPTAAKKRVYEIGGKGWGGVVEITDNERSAKVEMETNNERGATCTVAGTASPNSPSKSLFRASDATECTAELLFSEYTVKVKSHGCESYCGAAAPGFDYTYKLKR